MYVEHKFTIDEPDENSKIMESKASIDSDFSQYLSAVNRHWIPALKIFASTVALTLIASSFIKSAYKAEGKLLFKNSAFKVVGPSLSANSSEGGGSGDLKSLISTQSPITTQIEVLTSRPLLQKVITHLELKDPQGQALTVRDLKPNLNAKIAGGSDVLQIEYKDRDPEQAARVVNTLMNVYLENDVSLNSAEAETARKFMTEQLPKTQQSVNAAEVGLRNFKQQHNVVDLNEESRSAVNIIGNLDSEGDEEGIDSHIFSRLVRLDHKGSVPLI